MRYTSTGWYGQEETSFFVGTVNKRNPLVVDIGGINGCPIRVSRDRIQKIADKTFSHVKTQGDLFEQLGVYKQKGLSVQPPSFVKSLIPVYGSYKQMCYEAERGSVGGVLLAGGLMATDLFCAGSLVKCAKMIFIGGARVFSPALTRIAITRGYKPFHVMLEVDDQLIHAYGGVFGHGNGIFMKMRRLPPLETFSSFPRYPFNEGVVYSFKQFLPVLSKDLALIQNAETFSCVTGVLNAWSRGNYHIAPLLLPKIGFAFANPSSGKNDIQKGDQ